MSSTQGGGRLTPSTALLIGCLTWCSASSCRGDEDAGLRRADQLLAQGKPQKAIEQYRRELDLGPHAAASRGLGLAYEAQDRPVLALGAFQAALDGLTEDVPAQLGHARVSAVLGNLAAARQGLRDVLARRADFEPAVYLFSLYARQPSDLQESVQRLERIVETRSAKASATAYRILADSYDRLGNQRRAKRARQTAALSSSETHEVDFQLAQAALASGRHNLAVELLTPLVEVARSNTQYTTLLTTAYLAGERWTAAHSLLASATQVTASEREWLSARYQLGVGYGSSSIAAMQQLLATATLPAKQAERQLDLSMALRSAGRYEDAQKATLAVPEEPRWQRRRQLELASIELGRRNFAQAVKRLSSMQANHREDGTFFELLGKALVGSGQLAAAEEAFRQEVALVGDQPQPARRLAEVLLRRSKPSEAVEILKASIERFPQEWPSIVLWMKAMRLSGDAQVAAELVRQAATSLPDRPLLWVARGQQLFTVREYTKALTAFRHAATMAPDHPRVIAGLSLTYAELDRNDLALATLQSANPAGSTSVEQFLLCARLYRSLGSEAVSDGLLSEALKQFPRHPWIQAALASSWATQKEKLALSRQLLAEAVAELPAHPAVLAARAWVASLENAHAKARQYIDAALQLQANDSQLRYLNALLLLKSGQHREAREQFALALELDPLLAHGRQVRAFLRSARHHQPQSL